MKATIFAASLYAALASATIVSSGEVDIALGLTREPGGSFVGFTVPFGVLANESCKINLPIPLHTIGTTHHSMDALDPSTLFSLQSKCNCWLRPAAEDGNYFVRVSGASGTPIPIESIVCQAYQDAAGTIRIGKPFDESTAAQISIGDVDDSVRIASFFCSDAAGVKARNKRLVRRQTRTVRVQVNFEGEGAVQIEVPVDNTITRIFGTVTGNSAFITSSATVAQGVSCQAYQDLQATQRIGSRFSVGQTARFSTNGRDVTVRTLRCRR